MWVNQSGILVTIVGVADLFGLQFLRLLNNGENGVFGFEALCFR